MTETVSPGTRTPGDQASAISRLLVKTMAEYTGRGPTKARTSIAQDVITVVLDDNLTRAEQSLAREGYADEVLRMRRAFQRTMATTLIAGVEEITGRQVEAFLSDNHIGPDIAVETFVLRPRGKELDDPDHAAVDRKPSR